MGSVVMYQVLPDPDPDDRSDERREVERLRFLASQLRLARVQSYGPLREEW